MSNTFLNRQAQITEEYSEERKEAERRHREETEREYWSDYHDREDRMQDGSDSQGYDEWEED